MLANRNYRHLFLARVITIVGTGLAIKMAAYGDVAPVAGAFAARRTFLVAMDLVRAGVALCLPFISEVWQLSALIFVLQSDSATFTPTFQATIPEILSEERDYTRALSLSRLKLGAALGHDRPRFDGR